MDNGDFTRFLEVDNGFLDRSEGEDLLLVYPIPDEGYMHIYRDFTLSRSSKTQLADFMQRLLSTGGMITCCHQIGRHPVSLQGSVSTFFRLRFMSQRDLDSFHEFGYKTSEPQNIAEALNYQPTTPTPEVDRHTLMIYCKFIQGTYNSDLTYRESVANCTIGLAGELMEWSKEHDWDTELLEAGDVLYYLTMLLGTLGDDDDLALLLEKCWGGNFANTGQIVINLTDRTKKHLYYNPSRYNRSEYLESIKPILRSVLGLITNHHTLYEIITANTKKLSDRYNVPNPLESHD